MVTVESGSGQSGSGQRGSGPSDQFAGFGPNEWLVYEMDQQYLKDPESVDKAWGDFFAGSEPARSGEPNGATKTATPEPTTERPPTTTAEAAPAKAPTPPAPEKAAKP